MSFARQSSWMVGATTVSGCFMFAVHPIVVIGMGVKDYGVIALLLQMLQLMMIPAAGVQTIFAHRVAAAVSEQGRRELCYLTRRFHGVLLMLWCLLLLGFGFFHEALLAYWGLSDRGMFWITLAAALPILWLPIHYGILQGQERFDWLGIGLLSHGAGRLVAVAAILLMMETSLRSVGRGVALGALVGAYAALLISAIKTYPFWAGRGSAVSMRSVVARVIPITLGPGMVQFMLGFDMIAARGRFTGDQYDHYALAGLVGRGLVMFVGPIAGVMFPKIVRLKVLSQPHRLVGQTLIATGALCLLVAGFCSGGAWLAARLASGGWPEFSSVLPFQTLFHDKSEKVLSVAGLVPWFVWGMAPLALANVTISRLVAYEDYRQLGGLIVIAAGYAVVLFSIHLTPVRLLGWMGAFNLLLFLVSWALTRLDRDKPRTALPSLDAAPKDSEL